MGWTCIWVRYVWLPATDRGSELMELGVPGDGGIRVVIKRNPTFITKSLAGECLGLGMGDNILADRCGWICFRQCPLVAVPDPDRCRGNYQFAAGS